jgi:hypothetical protein
MSLKAPGQKRPIIKGKRGTAEKTPGESRARNDLRMAPSVRRSQGAFATFFLSSLNKQSCSFTKQTIFLSILYRSLRHRQPGAASHMAVNVTATVTKEVILLSLGF